MLIVGVEGFFGGRGVMCGCDVMWAGLWASGGSGGTGAPAAVKVPLLWCREVEHVPGASFHVLVLSVFVPFVVVEECVEEVRWLPAEKRGSVYLR